MHEISSALNCNNYFNFNPIVRFDQHAFPNCSTSFVFNDFLYLAKKKISYFDVLIHTVNFIDNIAFYDVFRKIKSKKIASFELCIDFLSIKRKVHMLMANRINK